MNPLVEPQSQETKDFLEKEMGLRPYTADAVPHYADIDTFKCKWQLLGAGVDKIFCL